MIDENGNTANQSYYLIIAAKTASGIMMSITLRGYTIWLINLVLCIYFFTQTFKISDYNRYKAAIANPMYVPPTGTMQKKVIHPSGPYGGAGGSDKYVLAFLFRLSVEWTSNMKVWFWYNLASKDSKCSKVQKAKFTTLHKKQTCTYVLIYQLEYKQYLPLRHFRKPICFVRFDLLKRVFNVRGQKSPCIALLQYQWSFFFHDHLMQSANWRPEDTWILFSPLLWLLFAALK